ncbi:sigma-54 interaction domain-containing protein [Clostridium polynesiense]|uniref:sigma-54 interaction domain-containing protein n=1 Tax=Clostridium polynesiense TaxID=1325933 RepID=UPI00058FD72B|nr:sigma 54-interacting transcriptional regulator [Clostridium polynesiense]
MFRSRIAIVSGDEKINLSYKKQLEAIFEKDVEIVLLSLKDGAESYLGFDLILSASPALYDEVKSKAPLNVEVINIVRSINLLELNKILSMDSGKNALVVSNILHSAQETIDLLKELGLNKINYIPYAPGCHRAEELISKSDFAIAAGTSHYVPEEIDNVIDLGNKIIDISTIVRILLHLDLPIERINLFTMRYLKVIISLNRKISDLRSTLIGVLDASTDGILAIDWQYNITFKNNVLEKFLNCRKSMIIGDNISKYINDKEILDFIKSYENKTSEVFKINNKDIILHKNYLKSDDKITGKVISFSYVSDIQDIEKEIRKKLSIKGNVARYDFCDIIGSSKPIKSATDISKKAAKTDLSVLLLGENGTGKELFAQAIHRNSLRSNGPFVAANFAALSEGLIESELFGYEDGAFTGAKKGGKPGLFELAHMGTIFLDEIGDAPLSLQAKLLRVIQEKEVLRVGGISPISIDVRVIAATNRDLKSMINDNLFRRDLYYRLNTITIKVPSLRERKEDIPEIIRYYNKTLYKKKCFSKEAFDLIMEYNWPGNVRELQNLIQYTVEIVEDECVQAEDLPIDILESIEAGHKQEQCDEDIVNFIENHDNINLIQEILNQLYLAELQYKRASRAYLEECLCEKGIPATINIIRRVLTELEELELVNIGSTKQGTKITSKGRAFLEKLRRCSR